MNVFHYCETNKYEKTEYFVATVNDFIGVIECMSWSMDDLRRQIHNIINEQLQNLGINPGEIIIKEHYLPNLVY